MGAFSVTHNMRIDDFCVIQTLEETDIAVGLSFTLAGVGDSMDGTQVLLAVPLYLLTGVTDEGDFIFDYDVPIPDQLLFRDAGTDVARHYINPLGTLTYTQTCTWITSADCLVFLGIDPATANDTAYLAMCVNAANAWVLRKRQEAGYFDQSLSVAPSNDVKLGSIIYACMNYRERGSIDSFQVFDSGGAAPVLSMGRVMQLIGCNRSQVA
jgi:hypothetical protein